MSNAYFAFRQFSVRQDRCAMKVSTDACIFGAWIPLPEPGQVKALDIGTGTGLLSLMITQRAPELEIDAVEIDAAAAEQASENVADSIFKGRIRVVHADARAFVPATRYDLIFSNPPFFSGSLRGSDAARNAARHDGSLDLAALFAIVTRLLEPGGRFALLMPCDAAAAVLSAAAGAGLHACLRLDIRDRTGAAPKRSCWLFGTAQSEPEVAELVIRDGPQYSQDFRKLLGPFYLRL